jgi:hypothetical protein
MAPDPNLQAILDFLKSDAQVLLFGGIFLCITLWVVFGSIVSIVKNMARERTRREIAAYIAEGSMTPEQGERLLRAGDAED